MTFGNHLKSQRTKRGLTQKKLAEALGRGETDISNWERNITEPNLQDFENLQKIYGAEFVRQLLNLSYRQVHKNIQWIELLPNFLPESQHSRITTGIHFFHSIIKDNVDFYSYLNGYRPDGIKSDRIRANTLYSAFQFAVQMGVLRLVNVPMNTSLAAQMEDAFADMGVRHVYVTDIGGEEYPNYDCAPIRAEFVAFAASRELFGQRGNDNLRGIIALGSGYTVCRTMYQSVNYQSLIETDWMSLIAYEPNFTLPYAANSIATHLTTLHPGSYAALMPVQSQSNFSSELSRIESKLYGSSSNPLRAIVITVNGFGYDHRGLHKTNTSQRYVDGYSQDWVGSPSAIYQELDGQQKQSVAGELLGVLIDEHGQTIAQSRSSFSTQFNIDILKDFRELVWLVASMKFKAPAVLAAIRDGLVGNLVIDASIAKWILDKHKADA